LGLLGTQRADPGLPRFSRVLAEFVLFQFVCLRQLKPTSLSAKHHSVSPFDRKTHARPSVKLDPSSRIPAQSLKRPYSLFPQILRLVPIHIPFLLFDPLRPALGRTEDQRRLPSVLSEPKLSYSAFFELLPHSRRKSDPSVVVSNGVIPTDKHRLTAVRSSTFAAIVFSGF
jgi:hypothetical protein